MAEVRATFDNQQSYKKFVNALKSSIALGELGKLEPPPDSISYNPGTTVTITCDKEDLQTIEILILLYGRTVP